MAALLVFAASGGIVPSRASSSHTLQAFPRITLWAWESPQDLRQIPPGKYAIAYLERTLFITDHVEIRPRMQPLLAPQGAKIIAVIRIEARFKRRSADLAGLAALAADQIAAASRREQVSAVQIDFDAAESQRTFYRKLVDETRRRIPAGMPLSITALASWCAVPSWLEGLPVDEAVPMLFRMGEDKRFNKRPGWNYSAGEPLCQKSIGVSTDEAWPAMTNRQRIYVFHPRSWNPVALANLERLVQP